MQEALLKVHQLSAYLNFAVQLSQGESSSGHIAIRVEEAWQDF